MEIIDVLRCLAEADAGVRRPTLAGPHVFIVWSARSMWDDDDDDDEDEEDENDDGARSEVGAGSLYDALDAWAAYLVGLMGDDLAALTEDHRGGLPETEPERWARPAISGYAEVMREISTPARRLLAYFLLAVLSPPMNVVTRECWRDFHLGDATLAYPGARHVLVMSAAPPFHGLAFAIVERQPAGTPVGADRSLLAASRAGDVAALRAALAAGADVDGLDEHGMAALHVAVGHRHGEVVAELLSAGAKPDRQAAYGNAPQFAACASAAAVPADGGGGGTVLPAADRIAGDDHERVLRTLLAAGAPVDAGNRIGLTLLDLALRTRPYPEAFIAHLRSLGAGSPRVAEQSLGRILENLPHGDLPDLELTANTVRHLLESGADPNAPDGRWDSTPPLTALLDGIGYDVDDVPPELLIEMVEALLRHGAGAGHPADLAEAMEAAQGWVDHGFGHYGPIVDLLRAAASAAPG